MDGRVDDRKEEDNIDMGRTMVGRTGSSCRTLCCCGPDKNRRHVVDIVTIDRCWLLLLWCIRSIHVRIML